MQRKLARVALFLGVFGLSLIVCELLVRQFALAPQVRRINVGKVNTLFQDSDNPILGYELRPNARDTDREHSPESQTNSHGQWDRERTLKKPEGTRRILLLGDSVVFGGDVYDYRDTISGQLERLLAEQSVEVLNFGVVGYCTRSEVEILKEKGLKFQPDLVVLLWVWNDYLSSGDLGRTVERTQPRFARWLFLHSHLFRAVCLSLNLFSFRDLMGRMQDHQESIGESNVAEGFSLLRALSAQHDFEVLVVIWPFFGPRGVSELETYKLEPQDYRRLSGDDPMVVEGLARDAGLPVVRLSNFMRGLISVPQEQVGTHYTVDGMHATEAGCELAAQALFRILKSRNWLTPREREDR